MQHYATIDLLKKIAPSHVPKSLVICFQQNLGGKASSSRSLPHSLCSFSGILILRSRPPAEHDFVQYSNTNLVVRSACFFAFVSIFGGASTIDD